MTLPFQPHPQESLLLNTVLKRVSVRSVEVLETGGSPAHVLHITTRENLEIVLKYLFADDGQVDGHDLASFRLKCIQIQHIRANLPSLQPFYTEILEQFDGVGWSAYSMPFYRGESITKSLKGPFVDISKFSCDLQSIVQVLVQFGYAAESIVAPDHYFEEIHIDRVRRRQWLLFRHLPLEVLSGNYLSINSQVCIPALTLIENLRQSVDLLSILQPSELHFPVHGDANLGNFLIQRVPPNNGLVTNLAFKILDPRGTLNFMNASYDFAKMLFSLSIFELAMDHGFEIQHLANRTYKLHLRGGNAKGYSEAAASFLDILESVEAYRNLTHDFTTKWSWGILFAHAVHAIAESACRLSDQKERVQGNRHGFEVCQELALGLYLVGTLLLNDLFRAFISHEVPDIVKHLKSLNTIYS